MMQRDREKKAWTPKDRVQSYHGDQWVDTKTAAKQKSAAKQYRAALEALFEKKQEFPNKTDDASGSETPEVPLPRVVEAEKETPVEAAATPEATTPAPAPNNKRQELLKKITNAKGSKAISDAMEAFFHAGHTLPDDQELYLLMLEHRDEERVREALRQLERMLNGQLPKRKPVLVQRLRRLEENAEEEETRNAAAALRRKVG